MHGTIHLFERLPRIDEAAIIGSVPIAHAPVRATPLVGLIQNPRSHGNEAHGPAPARGPNVLARTPRRRADLADVLTEFAKARVDYVAIDGGDGTVRDVLTCGAGVFGETWPALIVLPTGKTNALAHDLGVPRDWSLDHALAAAKRGKIARRHTLVVSQRDDARNQVRGFVLGAGAFTRAIALGQKSHKLGAFDNAVVVLTAAWSVVQALLGSEGNAWRRGTHMRVGGPDGEELPHRGGLPANERYLLFASTLERFPTGLNPFRGLREGMRLAVLDNSKRGLLFRLGAIFRGTASARTKARGHHAFAADAVDFDIGEEFILDGEAFPAGQYRLSAGSRLRFVVP